MRRLLRIYRKYLVLCPYRALPFMMHAVGIAVYRWFERQHLIGRLVSINMPGRSSYVISPFGTDDIELDPRASER